MQLVPVKFFRPKQSVGTKPIPGEKPTNENGPSEDGFTCAGYTSQMVIDKIWGPIEGWLRSGMKGSLMLHLQGLAMSVDPSQVTKNSLKAKRVAIPKPVAPLFTIPEAPIVKTDTDAGSNPSTPGTTELKINSSVPFSVKVEQTEKNGQKSTISEYHSSGSAGASASAAAAQFIDSEAVEVGTDEEEEEEEVVRRKKRKRGVRFAPTRKPLGSNGVEVESDDGDSGWEDIEEGEVKDNNSLKDFLDDEEVISCNNQAEAEMVLNRKKMTKREHFNNSNAKKSLAKSIHSITNNIKKAKTVKKNGQSKGTAEPEPSLSSVLTSVINENPLYAGLAECRRRQRVNDGDDDDNDDDDDYDNNDDGKIKDVKPLSVDDDDEIYVSDEEDGVGVEGGNLGQRDVDYRKQNLNDDFIQYSQSID